ncbi:MAG: type II toxin-antitoxin system VapC family toxin [Gemmatimonadota bacterium]
MIVADTGAILALVDADDRHHRVLLDVFEQDPEDWMLPWAILPEVDYLLASHVGPDAELAFLRDLAEGRYAVEWGDRTDLKRAYELCDRYRDLRLGLVDGVVVAVAERLGASGIATLDERHFGAIEIRGKPKLLPREP